MTRKRYHKKPNERAGQSTLAGLDPRILTFGNRVPSSINRLAPLSEVHVHSVLDENFAPATVQSKTRVYFPDADEVQDIVFSNEQAASSTQASSTISPGPIAIGGPAINGISLNDDQTYCIPGDQTMVEKWKNHSSQRLVRAFWFGVPGQIALYAPEMHQLDADGDGTFYNWLAIGTNQLGSRCSAWFATIASCVGTTQFKVINKSVPSDWSVLIDMEIPEGKSIAVAASYFGEFPGLPGFDEYIRSVSHGQIPWNAFGPPKRFTPTDVQISASGTAFRYYVHLRRPDESLEKFSDARPLAQAVMEGDFPGLTEANLPTLPPPD